MPAVEQAATFEIFSGNPVYVDPADRPASESDRFLMTVTGPAFADLFTFDRVAGAPLEEALAQPYSMVLTQSAAKRYFGDANPVGQTLTVDSLTTTVRAVIADPPANSRITFDFALQVKEIPNWGAYQYVRLAEGADPRATEPKISAVMDEVDPRRVNSESRRQNLKGDRLTASSAVQAVGDGVTPNPGGNRTNVGAAGSDVVHRDFHSETVDVGWFDAMGIEHPVVDAMRDAGASAPQRVLINQAAVERFGFANPVGEEIVIGPNYDDPIRLTVDGVLPNMHFRPMRSAIQPAVFRVQSMRANTYGPVVRFAPGRIEEGRAHLRDVWSEVRPDPPLQTTYLDDQVAALYEQEQRFGTLSAVLAGIAIVLAALGLASLVAYLTRLVAYLTRLVAYLTRLVAYLTRLVAYLTRLRQKEIGVRKSMGASVPSIVALLNKEYVQIVAVAFGVGTPLAWGVADWWLGQFAYRVDLSPWIFAGTGLGALFVAVIAVTAQALRAAQVDPAEVLRTE